MTTTTTKTAKSIRYHLSDGIILTMSDATELLVDEVEWAKATARAQEAQEDKGRGTWVTIPIIDRIQTIYLNYIYQDMYVESEGFRSYGHRQ
jgi:hypothetical protein